MRTIYLDCSNGASGDMFCAALWELLDNQEAFLHSFNDAGIPGIELYALPSEKYGISGTHIQVTYKGESEHQEVLPKGLSEPLSDPQSMHGHTHEQHSLSDITAILDSLHISKSVRENAGAVYRLIAEAESSVHGITVSEIHFHEVGTMDAIADIVCACMLVECLHPDKIASSSVQTGSGKVRCMHGILPVPAPATANLLQGIPVFSTEITGELCTPTGAALLKHFVHSFGPMPTMNIEKIGYGMGSKDYGTGNYLRAFLGETDSTLNQYDTVSGTAAAVSGEPRSMPSEEQRKAVSNRLARSIGHLESVRRMVDTGRDVSDILIQLSAVESSLAGTSRVIMKNRFDEAIEQAVKDHDEASLEALYGVIDKYIK